MPRHEGVDTVFGHVPKKLMEYGSAGGKVMLDWQKSFRWVMTPMIRQQDMTKSGCD
jgi:hypothetical protein